MGGKKPYAFEEEIELVDGTVSEEAAKDAREVGGYRVVERDLGNESGERGGGVGRDVVSESEGKGTSGVEVFGERELRFGECSSAVAVMEVFELPRGEGGGSVSGGGKETATAKEERKDAVGVRRWEETHSASPPRR